MVDLALLQSISYMAGALGVCFAAVNYVLNLRETNRNRRITMTTTLVQSLLTLDTLHIEAEMYLMKWRDYEDFKRKYDSTVNVDNFAYRMRLWGIYEAIGTLYRSGLLDMKSLFCVTSISIVALWVKFKPIIEDQRINIIGREGFRNWEYVANEVAKYIEETDPLWRSNAAEFFSPEEYDRTFKPGAP